MMKAPERILVAEDSRTQGEELMALLESGGFEVAWETTGERALEVLTDEERPFDLLLSDIMMPGIDGYELCRRVKAVDPDLPVMLLTSLTDPLDVVRGLDAGADNFLRKPYEAEQLLNRVRTILYNREMRRSGRANMGLELFFRNRRFMITADRQQILDLLVSTFEDLVVTNADLRMRERELERARQAVEDELSRAEAEHQRLRSVLAGVPSALVIVDERGRVTEASDALTRLLDVPLDEILGADIVDVVHLTRPDGTALEREERPIVQALRGEAVEVGGAFDVLLRRRDGTEVPVVARSSSIWDRRGAVSGAVGMLVELVGLAGHDPLTHLPTHALFADRVGQACAAARQAGRDSAVVALVVPRQDRVRERVGKPDWDDVQRQLARRLEQALRHPDIGQRTPPPSAAFIGDGTFAFVIAALEDEMEAVRISHVVLDELCRPVQLASEEVELGLVGGVAIADPTETPDQTIRAALVAAQRAAERGSGHTEVYDPAMNAVAAERLRLEADLRAAIAEDQLSVYYQPVVAAADERGVGAEALVRWWHPDHGLLSADRFVPLAEEAGLVAPLSWWVLERACREVADWRRRLPSAGHMSISVNLSADQLAEDDVVEKVATIVETSGLAPDALVLELTESAMIDAAAVVEQLRQLKALGIRIAIDDFGTGYSSLLQLRRLPVDTLKIDRSFIDGMTTEAEDAAIVAGTVRLARALGLNVVAEGVETPEQLVQLRVLGCDMAQGYLWSPALPPEDFDRWWAANARTSAPDNHVDGREPLVDVESPQDDMLAYLVHELRSPLTAVLGFAELAAGDGDLDATTKQQYVDAILRNAVEMRRRLSSLDDLRALDAGVLTLDLEEWDVAALVGVLVADLAEQLLPHPVVFRNDSPIRAPLDRALVSQAVTNLLTNAAKFSPADAPIEVTVRGAGGMAEIAVRDHGPGIPEERRPELFRRFSRLGSRAKGMGVGLYVSRLLVRAHGGDIRYEPAAGGGACFVLGIPTTGRTHGEGGAAPKEPVASDADV